MASLLNELVQKFPSRISTSLLCALFVTETHISRISLSIAIVSMVQTVTKEMVHSDTKREPFCIRNISDYSLQLNTTTNFTNGNLENKEIPPIQMTSTERGNILSSFFYLYGVSAILGGRLAELYGAKKVCGSILLMDVLTNFLTPFVSQSSYWLFFTIRLTTGFFQGMGFPAINFNLSQWTPPSELSRSLSFVTYASNLGSILAMIFSGYVISLLGWEFVFYISGSFSLLCLTLWIFFLFDTPETHPRISLQEKRYIIDSLKERNLKKKPDSVLWLKMLKSLPVWAINFAHAGSMCGFGFLGTQLPIYLSSIIGVNIRNNGLLSALPFIGRFAGGNISSWLLHYIMLKCHWQLKTTRIVANTIGFTGPALSFLLVSYIGCSQWTAIFLYTLGATLNGFSSSGYLCSNIDISSNFSGTVKGISNLFAFLCTMLVPVVIGALTPEETISEWKTVLWFLFSIYIGTALFYAIFVSTDLQPWDSKNDQADENNQEEELKLTNSNVEESVQSSLAKIV